MGSTRPITGGTGLGLYHLIPCSYAVGPINTICTEPYQAVLHTLMLATVIYHVWLERTRRIYRGQRLLGYTREKTAFGLHYKTLEHQNLCAIRLLEFRTQMPRISTPHLHPINLLLSLLELRLEADL